MNRDIFGTLEKLIVAEKKAVSSFTQESLRGIEKVIISISKREGKIVTVGIGKSAFIAQKCAATLTSLGNLAVFVHPADAFHGDSGVVQEGDVVLAFSHSGESAEVVRLCKYLKKSFKIDLVAVTGHRESVLGRMSDHVISVHIKEEGSPGNSAPMASVTGALIVADLLSVGLVSPDFSSKHFVKYHPGGKLGLSLTMVKEVMIKKDLPLVDNKASLREAVEVVDAHKKGVVGIVEKGFLQGVVTDGDVRRMFVRGLVDTSKRVSDFMTKNPKTIFENENLLVALQTMEQWKITNLFVLDQTKKLVGFIHMHDIIETSVL
jgi:arabinose-5-phosphate isomerase